MQFTQIAVNKVEKSGVNGPILPWFNFYLSGHTQQVKIGNYLLCSIMDHLSPLLFIFFMNDINNSFHFSKFCLFVNHLKLYMPISSIKNFKKLKYDPNLFFN